MSVLDLPVRDFDTATRAFQDVERSLVPSGAIVAFGGVYSPTNKLADTCPVGWLWCDGSVVLRADYPALSRVLVGSGSAFSLPNNPGYIIKV